MSRELMIKAFEELEQKKRKKVKEFLYVGYYYDEQGRFVLKIGTTNDLKRRRYEHNYNYRKSNGMARMPKTNSFEYIWTIRLSKNNTLNYEELNKQLWQMLQFGEYLDNDRFIFPTKPEKAIVKIKKYYEIIL